MAGILLLHACVFPGRRDAPPKPPGSAARDTPAGTAGGPGVLMEITPWARVGWMPSCIALPPDSCGGPMMSLLA